MSLWAMLADFWVVDTYSYFVGTCRKVIFYHTLLEFTFLTQCGDVVVTIKNAESTSKEESTVLCCRDIVRKSAVVKETKSESNGHVIDTKSHHSQGGDPLGLENRQVRRPRGGTIWFLEGSTSGDALPICSMVLEYEETFTPMMAQMVVTSPALELILGFDNLT